MITEDSQKKEQVKYVKQQHSDNQDDSHGSSNSSTDDLSLRNLSKLILPPLGSTGYNQNLTLHKGYIITPMDSRYRCWETLMVLMVAYSAWVCPFEIAFMHSNPSKELYIADAIVDLFFAVDIILTFFVAYIDTTTQLLVRDRKKIAVRRKTSGGPRILAKGTRKFKFVTCGAHLDKAPY